MTVSPTVVQLGHVELLRFVEPDVNVEAGRPARLSRLLQVVLAEQFRVGRQPVCHRASLAIAVALDAVVPGVVLLAQLVLEVLAPTQAALPPQPVDVEFIDLGGFGEAQVVQLALVRPLALPRHHEAPAEQVFGLGRQGVHPRALLRAGVAHLALVVL